MSPSDESQPLPGTVFNARQVRILKIAVIGMGMALLAGLATVLGTIVYQAGRLGASGEGEGAVSGQTLDLGQGVTISNMALDGDRLALHLESEDGPEIAIVDLASGKVIARLKLRQ